MTLHILVQRTTLKMVKFHHRWLSTFTSKKFSDHGMLSHFPQAPLLLILGSKPGTASEIHWKRLADSLESQNRDYNRLLASRGKTRFEFVDPNDWCLLYDFLETKNSKSLWSLLLGQDKSDATRGKLQKVARLQPDGSFCGVISVEEKALQSTTKVFDLLKKHSHNFTVMVARLALDNAEYSPPKKPATGSAYDELLSLAKRSQRTKLEENLARIGELGLVNVEKHGKHLFIK